MKLVIAGSRGSDNYASPRDINEALLGLGLAREDVTEVVSGCCINSPDIDGEVWARERGIPVARFPAKWHEHGRRAGMLRNAVMASYADCGLVFWDGQSRGSRNMIQELLNRGKPVYVSPDSVGFNLSRPFPEEDK